MTSSGKAVIAVALSAVLLTGCSMNVDKSEAGKDKKVEIQTPVGELKVRTDDVQAKDTGLPVYANARELKGSDEDTKKANVNIDTPWFGLKVVALKYESDDTPAKVLAFYREEMKKYGAVEECQGDLDVKTGSGKATMRCKPGSKQETALGVGSEETFRIVNVKPRATGSEFALVYVNTHKGGKETN